LHTAPSFFQFPFLGVADKLAISRALVPLTLTKQRDTGKSFLDWLDAHGQTKNAIARFWYPILVSALSEELDRISISAAAQVVRESMKSPEARQMGVPTVPLTDLYNAAGDYIRARGGTLNFRQPVEGFTVDSSGIQLQLRDSQEKIVGAPFNPASDLSGNFDYLILALPFDALGRVLPEALESQPLREQISHFENSPITGIHLWFDRQISDLDHAVLLDRTIQWMFHKSRLQPIRSGDGAPSGSYIELVVSSSKTLIEKSRTEIVDLALAEVREFFPAARAANLVKSTVIKEVNATYSPRSGIDAQRPTSITPWSRVFLAGDWTATGWPATMEGAVRSGYLAAEALVRAAEWTDKNDAEPKNKNKGARFLSADLPPSGFMRIFS
jgi:squalene-associated FAD-dependent desaturase